MTVFQLQCVIEAVRQGSFALAADELYISQSTMGRQIRQLEEELQVSLFTREHNSIKLTPLGEELLPEFERYYTMHTESAVRMLDIVDRRLNRFRIGIVDSLDLIPQMGSAISQLKAENPSARIQVCHLGFRTVSQALLNGTVDLVFNLDSSMPKGEHFGSMRWLRDRMCLAVPKSHPNAGIPCISNEEICSYFGDMEFSLIAAEEFEGDVSRRQRQTFPDYDGSTYLNKISGPFAELDSLMMMVHSGLGITCSNEISVLQNDPNVRLIPLVDHTENGDVEHELYINPYWNLNNENELLPRFLKYLKQTQA